MRWRSLHIAPVLSSSAPTPSSLQLSPRHLPPFPQSPSLLPPIPFPASPHPLPCFPPSPSLLPPIPFPASPHPLPCFPPSPSLLPPIPFPASPHPLPCFPFSHQLCLPPNLFSALLPHSLCPASPLPMPCFPLPPPCFPPLSALLPPSLRPASPHLRPAYPHPHRGERHAPGATRGSAADFGTSSRSSCPVLSRLPFSFQTYLDCFHIREEGGGRTRNKGAAQQSLRASGDADDTNQDAAYFSPQQDLTAVASSSTVQVFWEVHPDGRPLFPYRPTPFLRKP
ncbi:unnamed protein product [Closterium sp. Yama58-4]|nr:unnamed protein product [Closterium sp. Yama58-4]